MKNIGKVFTKNQGIIIVDKTETGYLVKNEYDVDGKDIWEIVFDVFDKTYVKKEKSDGLSFGDAIYYLKQGKKVARAGWNGKGMFLVYVKGSENIKPYPNTPYADVCEKTNKETINILPHIDMYSAQGDMVVGWLASQTDMLSEDWIILNI